MADTPSTPTPSAVDSALIDVVAKAGIASLEALAVLREQSGRQEDRFEQLLIRGGYVTAEQLGRLKAQAHGWEFINLKKESVSPELLEVLPRALCERHKVVPLHVDDTSVRCAALNPEDGRLKRLLQKKFSGKNLQLLLTTSSAIHAVLAPTEADFAARVTALIQSAGSTVTIPGAEDPIAQIAKALLLMSVQHDASDLHLDPGVSDTVVRERVDGLLRQVLHFPTTIHTRVIQQLRSLANLTTSEQPVPQDGQLSIPHPDGRQVDVRLAIIPTIHGEKVVLRLLVAENQALRLQATGLSAKAIALLTEQMQRTSGMILVAGHSGSGTTTSLYAMLRSLNRENLNIATIEDPVEFDLPGVNQTQVSEKVGLTFQAGLRSILRCAPDVVLVGQIRDRETGALAINAAAGGCLVLSALQADDAATAIQRLVEMSIEPSLVASTVNVVVAQRLVRRLCPACRESAEAEPEKLEETLPAGLLKKLIKGHRKTLHLSRAKGCDLCRKTGYAGHIGIFEVLQVDDSVRSLVKSGATAAKISDAAQKAGMVTMAEDGIKKVSDGTITLEALLEMVRP